VLDRLDGDELVFGLDIGKLASSSCCQIASGLKAWPCTTSRAAYSSSKSSAISATARRARALTCSQSLVPKPVQRGGRLTRAHVAREPVGLMDGHVQLIALRVLDLQVLAVDAVHAILISPLNWPMPCSMWTT
jgi:hypothetical protein